MAFPSLTTFYLGPVPHRHRHRAAEGQRQRHRRPPLRARTTSAATPGSRSSTWGSTSARSSRRWSAAISARRSTGTSGSRRPASAWCSASSSTCSAASTSATPDCIPRRPNRRKRPRALRRNAPIWRRHRRRGDRVLRRRRVHRGDPDHGDAGRRRRRRTCCSPSSSASSAGCSLAATGRRTERKQLYVIGVLFLAAALFWSVFEQAGSTLNLFADRNTAQRRLRLELSEQLVPVGELAVPDHLRAGVRVALAAAGAHGKEPSSPAKFAHRADPGRRRVRGPDLGRAHGAGRRRSARCG